MGRAGFYEKLLARLERLGIERSAGQTPAELALAWEEHLPGFIELTDIYYRVRFGGERLDSGEARRAERLASAICLAALGDRRRPI